MTDCLSVEMRDALPDLIHGRLDAKRSAEVASHIAGCTSCADEIALLNAVAGSAPSAPEMNIDRIVAALPTPTKQGFLLHRGSTGSDRASAPAYVARRSVWRSPAVKAAAGLAIVAAGSLSLLVGRDVLRPEAQVGRSAPRVAAAPVTPNEVSPGSTANSSARTAERTPIQVAGTRVKPTELSLAGDVRDLSDEHLIALIGEMDKMDAIPEAEPEAIAPALADTDGIGGI
jgi:anti-sigma factor RsiW